MRGVKWLVCQSVVVVNHTKSANCEIGVKDSSKYSVSFKKFGSKVNVDVLIKMRY